MNAKTPFGVVLEGNTRDVKRWTIISPPLFIILQIFMLENVVLYDQDWRKRIATILFCQSSPSQQPYFRNMQTDQKGSI